MAVAEYRLGLSMLALLVVAGCAQTPAPQSVAAVPAGPTVFPTMPPGAPKGYIPPEQLPNSLALLPPPPAPGSAALKRDEDYRKSGLALRNTPRFAQATTDADLKFPAASQRFACAIGARIGPEETPHLYRLLGRTLIDVGLATSGAKNNYNRARPFVVHHEATCTPGDEAFLRTNGSYPSGHSAIGWGWALLFAELVPDRADAVLARGRDFGESRVICDVHWQSDVEAGRVIASATIARLHADAGFQSDLAAAKTEITYARGKQLAPAGDCAAEEAALKSEP